LWRVLPTKALLGKRSPTDGTQEKKPTGSPPGTGARWEATPLPQAIPRTFTDARFPCSIISDPMRKLFFVSDCPAIPLRSVGAGLLITWKFKFLNFFFTIMRIT